MSGRVLIIDDIPTNRMLLKARLRAAHFDVVAVEMTQDAIEQARQDTPDLILLDISKVNAGGLEMCQRLKADPEIRHVPVVAITDADQTMQRVAGMEAGADDFLSKPLDMMTLAARVRSLMRVKLMIDELRLRDMTSRDLGLAKEISRDQDISQIAGRVLICGSNSQQNVEWAGFLSDTGRIETLTAGSQAELVHVVERDRPDVIIVHQSLSDQSSGRDALAALIAQTGARQAGIVFVVGPGQEEEAAAALDLGAHDYLVTPFDASELVVRARSQLRRKLYTDQLRSNVADGLKLAVLDPLTGLYNRRYAMQHLRSISERSEKLGEPFAVMMMDIDRFKAVNDVYGHRTGDAVLEEVARRLRENLRGIDLVARVGGEEFLVVMPATEEEQARIVAERLRGTVESTPCSSHENDLSISVTLSIGVAASADGHGDIDRMIAHADTALYKAKEEGRNSVRVYSLAA